MTGRLDRILALAKAPEKSGDCASAAVLRLERQAERISVTALARELGISREWLRQIEGQDKLAATWAMRYHEALLRLEERRTAPLDPDLADAHR